MPMVLGGGIIFYSLLTNYGLSSQSAGISMNLHLLIDLLAGIFLALSPWLFSFDEIVYVPHAVVGVSIILVSLITERTARLISNDELEDAAQTSRLRSRATQPVKEVLEEDQVILASPDTDSPAENFRDRKPEESRERLTDSRNQNPATGSRSATPVGSDDVRQEPERRQSSSDSEDHPIVIHRNDSGDEINIKPQKP